MALPGRASSSSAPLLLGVALLLLLGLAEARTIGSSAATTTGALHMSLGRARRAQKHLTAAAKVRSAQISTSEPRPANATSSTGQALLRMQAGWAYQYTDWTPLNSCGDWSDITCSDGYQVISMDLDELLQGAITTDLGTLLYLTYFQARYHYFGGQIPTNIGNLRALVDLEWYDTGVTGPIPTSMGLCTLLTYLQLDENSLTGTIPSTLGNLGLLSELYLYENQFTSFGEIGNAGSMPTLVDLDMDYNLLTNVPSSFYKLVSLTYLVEYNNLVATLPTALSKMTQLQYIDMEYNRLVGTLPSWIYTLPGLTYIDLRYNYLTGPIGTPASVTNKFEFNFFTSGTCYNDNCQPSPCVSQRTGGPGTACARFCGADEPNGVCGGKGTCVPGVPLNTCICPGFRSKQQCNNNVCVCT